MTSDGEIDPTGFGNAADDYATHRAGFPPELVRRLESFGVGAPGQCLVDLGTGTGTLARQFAAKAVEVIGIDPDDLLPSDVLTLSINQGGTGGDGWAIDFLTIGVTSSDVPEPATMSLLAMGCVMLVRRRRRS